jgi:hypothetical protein
VAPLELSRLVLLRVATRPFSSLASFAAPRWIEAERDISALEGEIAAERLRLEASLYDAAGPEGGDRRHAILAVRRSVHNGRAPRDEDMSALPSSLRSNIAAHVETIRRLQELERRNAELPDDRDSIAEAWRDPLVREGIASSSHELAAKLDRVLSARDRAVRHGDRHVLAKALAYVSRFATKTSPNGVFCATSLGSIGGSACRVDGVPGIAHRDVTLSIAEARKAACTLAFDPLAAAAVVPRANPTLREDPDGYTFWRLASARRADDKESLSRVRAHPVLRVLLEELAAGRTLHEVRRRVAERVGVEEETLAPFIGQLVDSGIVVAEIEIPYDARRPLRYVAERAADAECDAAWIEDVLRIEDEVDGLAVAPLEELPSRRGKIARDVAALPRARTLERDELFRTDAAASVSVTLPSGILDEIRAAVGGYARLFAAMYPAASYRSGWVTRFLAKFPANEEIDLLDVYRVLTEQGESYRPAAFPEPDADDGAARRVLLAARDAIADRGVTTLAALLEAAGISCAPEPRWAAGVLFQIAAAEAAAIERGDHRVVLNGLFQGAGLSLSRFAHLLGKDAVEAELRRAWSVVEREGAIVAELTYNHLGRTANAGLRPAIFPYEIELPGDCVSHGATRLALPDLTVRWDEGTSRFVLTWRSRGIEVIPVINSGVSPVGFISFLVAIGEQDFQPVGYLPGFDREDVMRWPRVTAGRVIVFRERWVFRRNDRPDPTPRGLVRWRDEHALPRHVFAHTSTEPKPRYVDFESPAFLDLLRRALAEDAETLEIVEMVPGPGELWLDGHASEFLVQMSSCE